MLIALQLVGVLILVAATLKIGDAIGSSLEDALGEKPLRERWPEES